MLQENLDRLFATSQSLHHLLRTGLAYVSWVSVLAVGSRCEKLLTLGTAEPLALKAVQEGGTVSGRFLVLFNGMELFGIRQSKKVGVHVDFIADAYSATQDPSYDNAGGPHSRGCS